MDHGGGNVLYINITMLTLPLHHPLLLLLLPLPPPYAHYQKPHPLAGPLCSLLGEGRFEPRGRLRSIKSNCCWSGPRFGIATKLYSEISFFNEITK